MAEGNSAIAEARGLRLLQCLYGIVVSLDHQNITVAITLSLTFFSSRGGIEIHSLRKWQ